MINQYLIYMKRPKNLNGYLKWPVSLFSFQNEVYTELTAHNCVAKWLKQNNKIYYKSSVQGKEVQPLLKSQILTIIGPIPINNAEKISLNEVYTLNEAAKIWGLSDGSTIRKSLEKDKFTTYEAKKSESIWLVTHAGMMRLFGPPNESDYESLVVNKIFYDANDGNFKTEPAI